MSSLDAVLAQYEKKSARGRGPIENVARRKNEEVFRFNLRR
jgi:hypothetical protein